MKLDTLETLAASDEDAVALHNLMPLIVPSDYFAGERFPAPHRPLPCGEFALTAVLLGDNQSMLYLSKDRAERWEQQGILWLETALNNIRQANGGDPFTHAKYSDDGRLLCAFMMQEDGLGTSRVLCTEAISKAFPNGYRVAIPERSLGIAISKDLSEDEYRNVTEKIVRECYRIGSVPNSPKIYEPEELSV